MLNLIKSIAIQDQEVASNIAYLDNIMSGVDGATTFGYSITPASIQVNDNQKQQYLHDHAIDVRVIRGADTGILDAITSNNRQVKLTGYTPNGVILWHSPVYVAQSEQYDNRIISRQIRLTQTSTIGYTDGQTAIYAGENALMLYNVLARQGDEYGDFIDYVIADGGTQYADRSSVADDVGTSGAVASLIVPCGEGKAGSLYYYADNEPALNGFTLGADVAGSVSGENQYLVYRATGTDRLTSESILFPFSGVELTFSVNFVSASGAGGSEFNIGIEYIDATDTVISSSTQTTDIASVGRISVSGVTPANTRSVRVYVGDWVNANVGDLWVISRPCLAVGGTNQFTI